jgi:Tfp pilus assembly protein PilF
VLLALVGYWAGACSSAVAQAVSPPPQPSMWQSFKQAMTPKPAAPAVAADDPVSLQSKGKPGIDLYVAVARYNEESGRFAEAEGHYKRALQEWPNDLRLLLGYARLKDRLGESQEALRLYQRAAKANPREPAVPNNLAVHFARRGMLREAIGAQDRAIQLRPAEPRYRNNMAMLLVEAGRPQEAYFHLRAVYDDAVAHYNLGFLLTKKGQAQAAAQEFTVALQLNPSMAPARQWLNRLAAGAGPRPASEPGGYGVPARGSPPDEPRVASDPRARSSDVPSGDPEAGTRQAGARPGPAWSAPEPSTLRVLPPPPPSPPAISPGTPPRDVPAGTPPDAGTGDLQRLPPITRQPSGLACPDPDASGMPPAYWPRSR